jgi:hypothetical protein
VAALEGVGQLVEHRVVVELVLGRLYLRDADLWHADAHRLGDGLRHDAPVTRNERAAEAEEQLGALQEVHRRRRETANLCRLLARLGHCSCEDRYVSGRRVQLADWAAHSTVLDCKMRKKDDVRTEALPTAGKKRHSLASAMLI